jgi:hypothetical protein
MLVSTFPAPILRPVDPCLTEIISASVPQVIMGGIVNKLLMLAMANLVLTLEPVRSWKKGDLGLPLKHSV